MFRPTHESASPFFDFRTASATQLSAALPQLRAESLKRFSLFSNALTVPIRPTLNPPLWELGHVGWFQNWWIARNPERSQGKNANPNAHRAAIADDALYNSSEVAHPSRWQLPLHSLQPTLQSLEDGLGESLRSLESAEPSDAGLYFYRLAHAHEAMHAEAWAMMAHELGLLESPAPELPKPQQLSIGATEVDLSLPDHGFTFDNERGGSKNPIFECFIDSVFVSIELFATYLKAKNRQAEAEKLAVLPQQAPATHVNLADAQACAAWMGRRLPTEAEWMASVQQHGDAFAWGQVWEWTASPFTPFQGFTADPYRDYSAPWFGTHQVLKGASAWTLASMRHAHYRNFYLPQRRDMLCGFRTVSQ